MIEDIIIEDMVQKSRRNSTEFIHLILFINVVYCKICSLTEQFDKTSLEYIHYIKNFWVGLVKFIYAITYN